MIRKRLQPLKTIFMLLVRKTKFQISGAVNYFCDVYTTYSKMATIFDTIEVVHGSIVMTAAMFYGKDNIRF